MNYDFIEIGTSVHDTLIEVASNETVGLSVEPIKKYIDMLPNKPNVTKVNAAITAYRTSDIVDLYYIPDYIIDANGWPEWLKGCNSINTYHPQQLSGTRANEVRIDKVPLLNISELFEQYNVQRVKYLKIDTEGHDCVILNGLFDYLMSQSIEKYPLKIEFESNIWTAPADVDAVINRASKRGYKLISRGHDTILLFDPFQPNNSISTLKLVNGRIKLS
jgi:FkbM family methyltransferase